MRRRLFLVLLCLISGCGEMTAQLLEGRITGKDGKGIEGATVFVREKMQGTVADENGIFRMPVPAGNYTCEVSCLGFEKQFIRVDIGEAGSFINVQLVAAVYQLREVKVYNSKEDPAYRIMRHAIARAPYHRHQVKNYVSEVYTKGTARLDKIPRLLMLSKEVRKTVGPMIGKLFLLESVMEIDFTAPDKYERKVLAFSSTIPNDLEPGDALNIITASIYDPSVMDVISPLSPGAFSYYRFRFLECYTEGGWTINKIQVEPRKENNRLLKGWIYITEDDWSVVDFDLELRPAGGYARFKGIFHEVKPGIFLPTSYDIDVKVKAFGVEAKGKYYTSVKYKEVEVLTEKTLFSEKDSLKKKQIGKKMTRQLTKAEEQLKDLAAKETLTTRDAYRVARLSQEMITTERKDTLPPLEIRRNVTREKVTVDSMAMKRDSAYWIRMRAMPLKEEEKVSYQIKDSLKEVVQQRFHENDSLHKLSTGFRIGDVFMGKRFHLGKGVSVGFDGLLRAVPEYNFVDGFWIGQGGDLIIRKDNIQRLKIRPRVYFATARKSVLWEAGGQYNYLPMRRGKMVLTIGQMPADYKKDEGTLRLENSLTSLVYADNFMKFYGNSFLSFRNEIDVANGLIFIAGGDYEKRKVLPNRISYNFFNRTPALNSPVTEGGTTMPDNTSFSLYLHLYYTPRFYYRIEHGQKIYHYSAWPTFSVRYERGIPIGNATHRSLYDCLQVSVRQNIRMGIFDRISYRFGIGKFFVRNNLFFPDYKHFNGSGWIVGRNEFAGGFFLTDYYELSTNDRWGEGDFNYYSSYLLLKRLPFMQRFLFNEALHLRYIWTPGMGNYEECGYSLGVDSIGRVGVFCGFDRKGYRGVGVRIALSF